MKAVHKFFAAYYTILIQDCLDENLKMKLNQKKGYHEMKLSS